MAEHIFGTETEVWITETQHDGSSAAASCVQVDTVMQNAPRQSILGSPSDIDVLVAETVPKCRTMFVHSHH